MAALALCAGLVLFAGTAAADEAPVVTVSPSADLVDGQSVTVTGTGFPPGQEVGVIECSVGTWPDVSCAAADVVNVVVDADGAFTAGLTVRARFEGIDPTTGEPRGTVDCRVAPGCSVRAGTTDGTVFVDPVAIAFAG